MSGILNNSGYNSQSGFIQELGELLNQNNLAEFIKSINVVDMWGGAGAVWEVYIENKEEAKRFEKEILKLISLMERTKILGKGIMPIRKIFKNNQDIKD